MANEQQSVATQTLPKRLVRYQPPSGDFPLHQPETWPAIMSSDRTVEELIPRLRKDALIPERFVLYVYVPIDEPASRLEASSTWGGTSSHAPTDPVSMRWAPATDLPDGVLPPGRVDIRVVGLRPRSPGRTLPLSSGDRVTVLVNSYGETLRRRLRPLPGNPLPGNLAKRSGPIPTRYLSTSSIVASTQPSTSSSATGASKPESVQAIGQYFQLRGLREPAIQLFKLLLAMDRRFLNLHSAPKAEQGTQLLRLVGAPGVGKSTALVRLWTELWDLLQQYPELAGRLDSQGSKLAERVQSSLDPERMLVFAMDLSKPGVETLAHREVGLTSDSVLALRLLYSTLHDWASPALVYAEFLTQLQNLVPLGDLQSLEILEFVKAALSLGDEKHSLIVFAVDEANRVPQPGPESSWLQRLFSSFVQLRCNLATARLKMMPVLITASTLASAATLPATSSGQSKVADVQLLPLSVEDMGAITLDVCARLSKPGAVVSDGGRIKPHITEVLKFLGGNPRHLAWALAGMAGSSVPLDEETLLLGKATPCPWLDDPCFFDLVYLINNLASTVDGWRAWLDPEKKVPLLNQILAHALLGRGVCRAHVIPGIKDITWQDAENAGVCLLVRTGCIIPAGSPASSRDTGRGAGCQSNEAGQADDPRRSTVDDILSSVTQQEEAANNSTLGSTPDQFVWMPPMLSVMMLRYTGVEERHLLTLPLCQVRDDWRSREFTDIYALLLKFQLLGLVLNEQEVLLSELVPGRLPREFSKCRVRVPCRAGQLLQRPTVQQQLQSDQFGKLCNDASYDSSFAFVGPSNHGPDGWLVLEVANGDVCSRLVLLLQSKKRAVSNQGRLKQADLDAEAVKCWSCPAGMQRLMVYVTDQQTSSVRSPYKAQGQGDIWVVVVGPKEHNRYYTPGLAFIKRSMEYQAAVEKKQKVA